MIYSNLCYQVQGSLRQMEQRPRWNTNEIFQIIVCPRWNHTGRTPNSWLILIGSYFLIRRVYFSKFVHVKRKKEETKNLAWTEASKEG